MSTIHLPNRLSSKISLAALTITTACFSLTGFAAACGSTGQTQAMYAASGKTSPWLGSHNSSVKRTGQRSSPTRYDHKKHADNNWSGSGAVAADTTVPSQPARDWTANQASQPIAETASAPTSTATPSPVLATGTAAAVPNPATQAIQPNDTTTGPTPDKKSSHCDHDTSADQQAGSDNQVGNQNDVTVNNDVSQSAVTGKAIGGATASGAATSPASLTSGTASNVDNTSTVVTVNSATAAPVTTTVPAGTTATSTVYATTTGNITDVIVNNIIEQVAVSGNASAGDGTWGGTVSSGNASNTANVVTYVVINE